MAKMESLTKAAISTERSMCSRVHRTQQVLLLFEDSVTGDSKNTEAGEITDVDIGILFGQRTLNESRTEKNWQCYLAIQPMLAGAQNADWTILPVRRSKGRTQEAGRRRVGHPEILINRQSISLQSLLRRSKGKSQQDWIDAPSITMLACPVRPASLDRIVIQVRGAQILPKAIQHQSGPASRTGSNSDEEATLKRAVRQILSVYPVVRVGDLLPLPSHGSGDESWQRQTGEIMHSEPIVQGICSASTQIILIFDHTEARSIFHPASSLSYSRLLLNGDRFPHEGNETEDEDFHSAVEDMQPSCALKNGSIPRTYFASDIDRDIELDSEAESEYVSDSSSNLIDVGVPDLGLESPDNSSGEESDTTRIDPHRTRSLYSVNTATTVVSLAPKGRQYNVRIIRHSLDRIAEAQSEFQTDRVYVDLRELAKLRSFVGDWMRLEYTVKESRQSHSPNPTNSELQAWRPVKLYALPEGTETAKPEHWLTSLAPTVIRENGHSTEPVLAMSPSLWVNCGACDRLKLVPFPARSADGTSGQYLERHPGEPPTASKLVVEKINGVLSTEKSLQPAIISGLKRFFSGSRRMMTQGDFFAISIDPDLSRALGQTARSSGIEDEMLVEYEGLESERHVASAFVWFRVQRLEVESQEVEAVDQEQTPWAGAAIIDINSTSVVQAGTSIARIPLPDHVMADSHRDARDTLPQNEARGVNQRPSRTYRSITELIESSTSHLAATLHMSPTVILLHSTQRRIGKTFMINRICQGLGLHLFQCDAEALSSDSAGQSSDTKVETTLRTRAERAFSCGPENTVFLIKHIEAFEGSRIAPVLREIITKARIVIFTGNAIGKLPDQIRGLSTHDIQMKAPDENERESILSGIIRSRGLTLGPDADLHSLAQRSAALVASDLVDVVERAVLAQHSRVAALAKTCSQQQPNLQPLTSQDLLLAGGPSLSSLAATDFSHALEAARQSFSDAIGAPKIPSVTWADVGGLSYVKDAISETISLPLTHPHLFSSGIKKRSGILFYGPPGTGKTLLAKAIATEFSLNFFSVKGPELLDMYIGESEANVRRVFARARDARPCVVFFDELDSVAPKRGNQGDSGGVMDRIVSQLLAELDGMSGGGSGGGSGSGGADADDDSGSGVFVIGATNRPDLLDGALLRPGRFDKMIYLGIPDTDAKQQTVLEALTRKFTLEPGTDLSRVVRKLPFNLTGADLYALCSDALLKAVGRLTEGIERRIVEINREREREGQEGPAITRAQYFERFAQKSELVSRVSEEDFEAAAGELVGSVSVAELKHYDTVRKMFEGAELGGGVDKDQSRK